MTFILLLAIGAHLLGIGGPGVLLTGDEKVYVATALEMRQAGSLGIPLLFGEPSYFKPPGQYWATLGGFAVAGPTWAGALLPSIAALALALLALVRLEGRGGRGRAAIVFAAGMGTFTYAGAAQMEIWLAATWALAWALAKGRDARGTFAAFCVAGLSSLLKSPLYFGLFGLSWAAWTALDPDGRRAWRRLLAPAALGTLGGALLGGAWFAWILREDPQGFIRQYWVQETLSKSSGNGASLGRMWLDGATFLIPFLVATLAGLVTLGRKPREAHLVAGMTVLPAVFFSAFPYKTETYLYLLAPGLALAAARGLDACRTRTRWRVAHAIEAAALAVALAFLAWRFADLLSPEARVVAVGSVAALALARATSARRPNATRELVLALLLIAGLRLAAQDAGRRDYAPLVAASSGADRGWILDEGRDIWNEVPFLSLASRVPFTRARDLTDLARGACDGRGRGIVVIRDDQDADAVSTALRDAGCALPTDPTPWPRRRRAGIAGALAEREFKIIRPL